MVLSFPLFFLVAVPPFSLLIEPRCLVYYVYVQFIFRAHNFARNVKRKTYVLCCSTTFTTLHSREKFRKNKFLGTTMFQKSLPFPAKSRPNLVSGFRNEDLNPEDPSASRTGSFSVDAVNLLLFPAVQVDLPRVCLLNGETSMGWPPSTLPFRPGYRCC